MKRIRFWLIIVGFLLPLGIEFFFVLIQDLEILLPRNNMIGIFFLGGLFGGIFNAIPFFLSSLLIKNKSDLKSLPELCMIITVIFASIFFYSLYYMDLTGNDPSSTGVLALFMFPFLISLGIPIGYLIGYIIKFFMREAG